MITNILANVVFVFITNTTEIYPQHLVADAAPQNSDGTFDAVFRGHYENDSNPTNKMIRTEVYLQERIQFNFDGVGQIITNKCDLVWKEDEYFILDKSWNKTWGPSNASIWHKPF